MLKDNPIIVTDLNNRCDETILSVLYGTKKASD